MGLYRNGPAELVCRDCGADQRAPRRNISVLIAEVAAALLAIVFVPFGFVIVLIVAVVGSVATRVPRCSSCGHRALIPSHTPEGARILKSIVRVLVLAGILAAGAAAADLGANETLPWCQVTISGDLGKRVVIDGWYDASAHYLVTERDIDPKQRDPFSIGLIDPASILNVVTAQNSPAMPAAARAKANHLRAERAKDDAAQAAKSAR